MTDESTVHGGMEQLSVRLTHDMFARLDALADERGLSRTRVVRQLLEAGLRDRPAASTDTPSEPELLAILAERARAGNVAAVRALLLRVERQDPADRWLQELLDDAAE